MTEQTELREGTWVRTNQKKDMQHHGRAKLVRLDGDRAHIQPAAHGKIEIVPASSIKPWKSRNVMNGYMQNGAIRPRILTQIPHDGQCWVIFDEMSGGLWSIHKKFEAEFDQDRLKIFEEERRAKSSLTRLLNSYGEGFNLVVVTLAEAKRLYTERIGMADIVEIPPSNVEQIRELVNTTIEPAPIAPRKNIDLKSLTVLVANYQAARDMLLQARKELLQELGEIRLGVEFDETE